MVKRLLVATFVAIGPLVAFAQNLITGHITDVRTGDPLIGASVIVKSEKGKGVVTDVDGNFKLETKVEAPLTLKVEYVGYRALDVDVYDFDEPVEIALVDNSNRLNEVVVLGYQTLKRKDITGSVASLSGKDLTSTAGTSVTEKLQGEAPGVLVTTASGIPGSNVFIRLRGTTSINAGNEPLYIVDGIPFNGKSLGNITLGGVATNPLSDINPDDIEKIDVLKDAAATAIYGARGANGVILITTKHGSRNRKTQVSFKAEIGWAKAAKLWDVMDGPHHAELLNERYLNDGGDPAKLPYDVSKVGNYPLQDVVFRTANIHNYDVSVSGGSDKTNFFIGGSYTSQEAIVRTQDYQRIGLRINLDHNINKNVKLSTSNSLTYTSRSVTNIGDGPTSLLQPSVQHTTMNNPFDENGNYTYDGSFENVYAIIDNIDNKSKGVRTINNVNVAWKITDDLQFKTSYSLDFNYNRAKRYFNSKMKSGYPNGNADEVYLTHYTLTAEQLLNYNKTLGKIHNLSAFAGNSVQYTGLRSVSLTGSNFPSDNFKEITSAAVTSASSGKTASSLVSWFGGVNYSLLDRYILEFNVRADASSRFGENNRWGYFPSFGTSWRISEEKFFQPLKKVVNEFKIKGSLGWTGNQEIDNYASLGLWSGGGVYNDESGVIQTQLANSDLKWETTRQWDLGFEASLFDDRLSVEFDVYNKYTTDLLLETPIPAKTGFSSIYKNYGEMSNSGVEFSLTSHNIIKKNFSWTTRFNISHNANKIERMDNPITAYNRDWFRLEEGKPMYSLWLYKELGIDSQTGNAIYEDLDGDGKITTADRQICGDAWPTVNGGLNNSFKYKDFDLSFLFSFSIGNKVLNLWRYFMENGGVYGANRAFLWSQYDRWTKPGDNATLPRLTTSTNPDGSKNYGFQSSRYLENGSFLRLRNISLGYTLPKRVARQASIENARVYVNVTNLFLITKYSGPDPESNVGSGSYNGTVQGLDFGLPPQPRQIVLGLNVTF